MHFNFRAKVKMKKEEMNSISTFYSGLVFIGLHFLMLRCQLDDPLDAVAVHCGGGTVGVLAVHIFAYGEGILWKVI